jgi:hypothetical protein
MRTDRETRSSFRAISAGRPALSIAVVGLASTVLTACGPSMREVAVNAFRTRHAECEAITVRERPELVRADMAKLMGDMKVYEISGCNADDVYPCFPHRLSPRNQQDVPATCSTSDWCSATGCWTPELVARHQFADDKNCPFDRVTAHLAGPPAAPDLAADPQNRRVGQSGHAPMTANGCGSEAHYDCALTDCKALVPESSVPPAPATTGGDHPTPP